MPPDPLVRRVAVAAVLVCIASALVAAALAGAAMAWGVLGGGVLIGISFFTLESGVAALVAASLGRSGAGADAAAGDPRRDRRPAKTLAKLVLRYALLGFLAYVMIGRLRLHPIGLMVGASSIVAGVFIEAVRLHTKKSF